MTRRHAAACVTSGTLPTTRWPPFATSRAGTERRKPFRGWSRRATPGISAILRVCVTHVCADASSRCRAKSGFGEGDGVMDETGNEMRDVELESLFTEVAGARTRWSGQEWSGVRRRIEWPQHSTVGSDKLIRMQLRTILRLGRTGWTRLRGDTRMRHGTSHTS